ncbi:MAG: RDD family protein [Pikeienuella sp.]
MGGQGFGVIGEQGGLPDPEADSQFYEGVPARRLLAFAIDIALIWGLAFVIGVLTLGIGFLLFGMLVPVLDFIYRAATISNRSATWGMRFAGVELRQLSGARFDLFHAVAHTILFYVATAFVVAQLVSVILMAGAAMGRGLHDLPFGSTMINSPA